MKNGLSSRRNVNARRQLLAICNEDLIKFNESAKREEQDKTLIGSVNAFRLSDPIFWSPLVTLKILGS